jgi:glycosyltransferase involved in cell wall biosynthesis
MPCLNEEETVGICVGKATSWLATEGLSGEVIVVDNGSTDRSAALAERAGARIVREERRGYGSALRRGIQEAVGSVVVIGDCDDTYDFSDLTPLLRPLREGYDISIGNRVSGRLMPGAMTWSHRYIGTPMITLLLRLFAGVKHGDSQCGLRAFRREAIEKLELRTDGMEFASEMLLKASRRGLSIDEVPIPYYPRFGESKLSTMRDGWRHLRFLLLASPNYLYSIPGAILTLLGLLLFALGLSFPSGISVGAREWQPVFAGGIFLVVGVNALGLGLSGRLYTTAIGVTSEDWMTRFYRKYLGLEVFLLIAALLFLLGVGTDLWLLADGPAAGQVPDRLTLAAVAQSLIIIGVNLGLVGAMASMLDVE